jgi:hypothetical protein
LKRKRDRILADIEEATTENKISKIGGYFKGK